MFKNRKDRKKMKQRSTTIYNFVPKQSINYIHGIIRKRNLLLALVFLICIGIGHQAATGIEMYKNYYMASITTNRTKSVAKMVSYKTSEMEDAIDFINNSGGTIRTLFQYKDAETSNFTNATVAESILELADLAKDMPLVNISVMYSPRKKRYEGEIACDSNCLITDWGEREVKKFLSGLSDLGWDMSRQPFQDTRKQIIRFYVNKVFPILNNKNSPDEAHRE